MSRRRVLAGLAAAGAAPVLAGCGVAGGGSGAKSAEPTGKPGEVLVAADKVPVGGSALADHADVIVTQPTSGTFDAFSSICTHQGCPVDPVLKSGHIHCSCHGSEFDPATGAVVNGPANQPLARVQVTVSGPNVVRA